MVKYVAVSEDGEESYLLAEIFEPLPHTDEAASVTAVRTDAVTEGSSIPTGTLTSSSGSNEIFEQPDVGFIGGGELAGGFGQE